MSEESKRGSTSETDETSGPDIGRRETLRLATLAAALGAGLSVTLHVDEAHADGTQLQLKLYRAQQKGDAQLVFSANLPEDASKRLLEAPGLVQWKLYSKEKSIGESQVQLKLEQQKTAAPPPSTPPVKGWDVQKNQKT